MTIYILRWTDNSSPDKIDNAQAFSNYRDAKKRWKELYNDEEEDITILDEEDSITKYVVKTQKDVIKLINIL